jgi:hypothetical protein
MMEVVCLCHAKEGLASFAKSNFVCGAYAHIANLCHHLILLSRCMKIPQELKIMGLNPDLSPQDLDGAAHEHAFVCRSRCPAQKTPGKSSLFPTEHIESSEWIVAWHAMKTIEKAMSFLRTHVAAGTRDAVMKDPKVAKMFHDAATIVRDRLKARPQDSASLEVPNLCTDSDVEEPNEPILIHDDDVNHYDFDEEENDADDEIFVLGHGRPRPDQPDLPPAQRAAHLPPPPQVNFAESVQFVVEATGCNRRAAIDALMAHNTADDAILWLLKH